MQVVQWFFAVANATLVARFSPFSLKVKGLIIFSYFFLYEYAVISRIYSLGLFLLLCCCAVLTREKRGPSWLTLGVLTALMALVIVHYWVIAACLMAVLGPSLAAELRVF
jgi:hypothetical protein